MFASVQDQRLDVYRASNRRHHGYGLLYGTQLFYASANSSGGRYHRVWVWSLLWSTEQHGQANGSV